MTRTEQLLAVAGDFGDRPFSESELVVAAWRRYPQSFALRGFPDHSDRKAVANTLYGTRGLVRTGQLRRVSANVYQVVAPSKRIRMDPDDEARLLALVDSEVQVEDGFSAAWKFWGSDGSDVVEACDRTGRLLDAAGPAFECDDGRVVTEEDVARVVALHRALAYRYRGRLEILRRRGR